LGGGAGAYFYFAGEDEPQRELTDVSSSAAPESRSPSSAPVPAAASTSAPEKPEVPAASPPRPVATNEPPPVATTSAAPDPAPAAPAPTVAPRTPQPAVPVSTPPAPAPASLPAASARFIRYAESIRVSGVFQGSPARALVDGRLVRSGDVLDPALGVSFVGVDVDTKHLILKDRTGAQVRVKY
jgi:hypothetical protein